MVFVLTLGSGRFPIRLPHGRVIRVALWWVFRRQFGRPFLGKYILNVSIICLPSLCLRQTRGDSTSKSLHPELESRFVASIHWLPRRDEVVEKLGSGIIWVHRLTLEASKTASLGLY